MSIRRIARSQGPDQDTGNTLIVAVMVAFLVMALGLVVIGQAVTTTQNSGKDRQRTAQVHTAEAGIDRVYYLLQTGSTPCPGVESRLESHGAPDETSVRASVQYFDAAGLPTDPCDADAQRAARAIITATATSANDVGLGSATQRTMESEVLLSPMTGGGGYAIFSEGQMNLVNGFHLVGNGEAADLYTRGDFSCRNNSIAEGNIVTRGEATIETCELAHGVYAYGDVLVRQSDIGGNVVSSNGSLTVQNAQGSIEGDVFVAGSVFLENGAKWSIFGGDVQEDVQNPEPPNKRLPYVGFDPSAWTGFTTVSPSTCADLPELIEGASSSLLIDAPACDITLARNQEVALTHDVAIFLEGDFTLNTGARIVSSDGSPKRLWLISPSGTVATEPIGWLDDPAETCDGYDITVETGGAEFAAPVEVFLYTCGMIQSSQDNAMYGQMYGGVVSITQPMDLTFVSMPPPGVDLGGDDITGYQIGVVYKRETANHLALTP